MGGWAGFALARPLEAVTGRLHVPAVLKTETITGHLLVLYAETLDDTECRIVLTTQGPAGDMKRPLRWLEKVEVGWWT